MHAISAGLSTNLSFLTATNTLTHAYAYVAANASLTPTPYGSHIIYHLRKYSFTQQTNFFISMVDPNAYAMMLATLDAPIKVKVPTIITIAGSHHQMTAHIRFNPHNNHILGRDYTNLYQKPLIKTINPTTTNSQVHPSKGLTSRRSGKWHGQASFSGTPPHSLRMKNTQENLHRKHTTTRIQLTLREEDPEQPLGALPPSTCEEPLRRP